MNWENNRHPRGGNQSNSGQFSSFWGTGAAQRKTAYARKYQKVAARKYERYAGDNPKAYKTNTLAARAKYYELQQKQRSGKTLTHLENLQMSSAQIKMRKESRMASIGGSLTAVGIGTTYVGSQMAVASAGGAGLPVVAAGVAGIGAGAALSHAGLNKDRDKILEVHGFHRDGILSQDETNAISAAASVLAIAGLGVMDVKMKTNLGRILKNKAITGAVSRNVRVSPSPVVKVNWNEGLHLAHHNMTQQIVQVAQANGSKLSKAEIQTICSEEKTLLDRDLMKGAGVLPSFNQDYHGNPFKDGAPRTFQFDAEKALKIDDALVGHFRASGALTTPLTIRGNGGTKNTAARRTSMEIQYAATQRLLTRLGVTHIDVTRGMSLDRGAARKYGIKPITNLQPNQTPWSRADIRLQPLNSFAMSPAMAVDYATNSVGGAGSWGSGNIAMIMRGRVPIDKVYGFTGFGPGHGSEIVLKGGWLQDMEIMVIDPHATKFQRITGTLGAVNTTKATNNKTADEIKRLWDWGMTSINKRIMSDTEIKHRKRLQAHISTTTGALGLAALGTTALAAKKVNPKVIGGLKRIGVKNPEKHLSPERLKEHTAPILATGAGVGALGSFNFSRYTEAESRKRKPTVVAKMDNYISPFEDGYYGEVYEKHG